jgi:multicomponent Na+:H+ antiporter subunit G
MAESLSLLLLLLGSIFMLLAAIGLARMPDVFMRLHSTTKSTTLGVGCIMLGVALFFNDFAIGVRALAIVAFMFSTTPVAAHMIGRAAYLSGCPALEGDSQRRNARVLRSRDAYAVQPGEGCESDLSAY